MSSTIMPLAGTRRKRDPYTRFACAACKRRKIKCSGDTPCTVCSANGTQCFYERCKRRRPSSPRTNRKAADRPEEPPNSSPYSEAPPKTYSSPGDNEESIPKLSSASLRPGSSNYFYTLAEELHTNPSPPIKVDQRTRTLPTLAVGKLLREVQQEIKGSATCSALSILSLERCLAIVDLYEDEIGLLYPFLELDELRATLSSVVRDSSTTEDSSDPLIRNDANQYLILILAIMAVLEDPDTEHVAEEFTAEARRAIAYAAQVNGTREQDIQALILVSIYYFMTDREVLAWRNIGTVLRILQELGYHSTSSLQQRFKSSSERTRAQKILWSAYTLDRRWSSGTGLPFAILESDIDYTFDTPDDSISSAYLRSMVAYCQIASECRPSIIGDSRADGHKWTDGEFSDFRIVEWRRQLPRSLQFDPRHQRFDPSTESRSQYRMRLLLYLRANQMRMMIRRQSTARPSNTQTDSSNMHIMIEVACDTIQTLSDVTQTCDVYHTQQRTFNHFLETAISSLLMAVARHQDLRVGQTLSGLTMAMDMVKSLAVKSSMMRKLRDKLLQLKIVQVILKSQSALQQHEAASPQNPERSPYACDALITSNVQDRSSTRRHSIHAAPAAVRISSSQPYRTYATSGVTTPSAPTLETLNKDPVTPISSLSNSTAPVVSTNNIPWSLATSDLGVASLSPPSETPNVSGMDLHDNALLDLQNFPYPYFSDLQGILDGDVSTFAF